MQFWMERLTATDTGGCEMVADRRRMSQSQLKLPESTNVEFVVIDIEHALIGYLSINVRGGD